MSVLGNIIWLVFGGLCIAIEYFLSSIVMFASIVGIPFGIQTVKLGVLALWPFGSKVEKRAVSAPSGCLYTIMNVLWFFVGGIWICLSHVAWGLLLTITIIGWPFAKQHFKLAGIALTPFGRDIVNG